MALEVGVICARQDAGHIRNGAVALICSTFFLEQRNLLLARLNLLNEAA
jgi:hypothetical protein